MEYDRSFQEMLQRCSRELLQMHQRARMQPEPPQKKPAPPEPEACPLLPANASPEPGEGAIPPFFGEGETICSPVFD